MTRARNIAGFSTITTTPSPVHVGPIGVLTATRIDGEFNQVDLATRNITAAGIAATNLQVSGITTGLNVSGIITAQNGINFNGTSTGLNVSGVGTIATLNVTGNATIDGNANIGGVLTYEDVTNVDSVGIVTARGLSIFGNTTGLNVASGISTFQGITATTATFSGDVSIADKIIHTGDTHTAIRFAGNDTITAEIAGTETFRIDGTGLRIVDKLLHFGDPDTMIRFPAADTFTVETGGSERLRIKSDGKVGISTDGPFSVLTAYGENRGEGTVTGQITAKDDADYNASPTAGLVFMGKYAANNAQAIFSGITGFKENANDGNLAGALAFHVRANGAVAYEALRIDSSGKILTPLGTTTRIGVADRTSGTGAGGSLLVTAGAARGSGQTTGDLLLGAGRGNNSATAGAIIFGYNNGADGTSLDSEHARFVADGRLLIRGQATFTSTSLTHRLQVKSQNDSYNTAFIGRNGDHIATLQFFQSDASTETGRIVADASTVDLRSQSDVSIQTGGANDRVRVLSNGRVGINTITAGKQVVIKDDAGGGVGITGSNAGIYLGMNASGGFQVNAAIARAAAANYHISGSAIGDLCVSAESTKDIIIGHSVNAGAMGEAMRVHHNGFITNSNNPAFHARGLLNNATAARTDDANVDAVFGTISLNKGSDYSNSNGRFTAPVSGHYFFGCSLLIDDNAATNNTYHFTFFKNGSFYARAGYDRRIGDRSGVYGPHMSNTCVVYLAENDYMTIRMDTAGFHTGSEANFCGFLIG